MRIDSSQVELDEGLLTRHEGEPYTGEVVKYADNGQLVHLGRYSDGIADGHQQSWWPSGTQRIDGVTDMGIAVGEWRHWHANGQLSERTVLNDHGQVITRQRWNAAGEQTMDKRLR